MTRGRLVVISGPSGVGKSTVCERLLRDPALRDSGLRRVVTCTTRPPRPGEVPGEHYSYLTEEEFTRRLERGELLEHARVHGHLYGTPRQPVEEGLARGETLLLNIDVQGAEAIRTSGLPGVETVFLLPPSLAELERRIAARSADSPEAVNRRLRAAREEMAHQERYDHVVTNDDLSECTGRIRGIILAAQGRRGAGQRSGAELSVESSGSRDEK